MRLDYYNLIYSKYLNNYSQINLVEFPDNNNHENSLIITIMKTILLTITKRYCNVQVRLQNSVMQWANDTWRSDLNWLLNLFLTYLIRRQNHFWLGICSTGKCANQYRIGIRASVLLRSRGSAVFVKKKSHHLEHSMFQLRHFLLSTGCNQCHKRWMLLFFVGNNRIIWVAPSRTWKIET